ncbi:MAG: hypothetical protein ABH840_01580 [Nanoarchaeota archaeon]
MLARNVIISLGMGVATLAGMILLLDSGYIDEFNSYVSGIADSVLGKSNILYEPIRSAFLTCTVPSATVSGLTSLVLD